MKQQITMFNIVIILLVAVGFTGAQDGLDLPTELYVLFNQGIVERYGLGTTGVEAITPEDAFVVDFGIAPGGGWMAYRTEESLVLARAPVEGGLTLDEAADVPPIRGRGPTLAWSPDASALAYTTTLGLRVDFNVDAAQPTFTDVSASPLLGLYWSPGGTYLAAEAEGNVWWIYRREGFEMVLTGAIPTSYGAAWFDNTRLIFAPPEGGLLAMDLAAANAQTVLQDNRLQYRLPQVRPDGSIVVFALETGSEENTGVYQRLEVVSGLLNVVESSETPIDLNGLRWGPDGRLLIAFRGGALVLIHPATGAGFPLPIANAVTYDWGPLPPTSVVRLSLTASGYFLAPAVDGTVQVWRLPPNDEPPISLTAADTDVTEYAVADDGRSLAYISGERLWLLSLEAPSDDSNALVELAPVNANAADLTFSPDGQTIAFSTSGSGDNPEAGIWIVPASGGEPQLVIPNGPQDQTEPIHAPPFYRNPRFAPNLNALLVTEGGSETTSFVMYDPNADQLLPLGQYDSARWLPDGRVVAWGTGIGIGDPPEAEEVYVLDPTTSPVEPLLVMRASNARVLDAQGIGPQQLRLTLSAGRWGDLAPIELMEITIGSGEPGTVANVGFMNRPIISPDGNFVAGYRASNEALVVFDVQRNQQVMLPSPTGVTEFRWGTLR